MISSFKDIENVDNIGNKAKSLAMMKKKGFNVPDGFVIDSDVFFETLEENALIEPIKDLLTKLNENNISHIGKEIRKLLKHLKIKNELQEYILQRVDATKKYAIRSSGTKEDMEDYSFAGQYQTFLNVKKDEIIQRMIDCYKSTFSDTILSYIFNREIGFEGIGMSVIVQEMVDAEYSGICFTINPVTGNDKEMLIEIGEGLGENIVSGKIAPEQYYYNWYDNTYHYEEKNHFLSEKQLMEFAKELFDIHLFNGHPCDIEFAIKEEKIYILQSRKITKMNYQGYTDMWSTADFKDGGVSATICYPYMWSLYEYIWEYTLRKFLLDSKILNEKEVDRKLGEMYYARPYWNLSVVKLAMSKVIGYKEREFDSEFGVRITYDGDGQTTKASLKTLTKIIAIAIAQKKIVKTRKNNAEKYKNDLLKKYDFYKEKYDSESIGDIKREWYQLTHDDYLLSESTYFWQIFINTIHQSLYKDGLLKYVSETEYLTLLGSIDNISHLLPFYQMWEISRDIRKDMQQFEYWQKKNVNEIVSDILKDKTHFQKIWDLVNQYGYHSDKELDVTYPCYFEDITPLIISIKDMVLLGNEYSPENDKKRGTKEYETILKKIHQNTNKKTYQKIEQKIKNMREMLWWREEFRDISTRFYYLIRVYTIELAKELTKENILKNKDDIWFLKVEDLWNLLNQKISSKEISNKIEKNKRYYDAYQNYMSENEIGKIFTVIKKEKQNENDIHGLGANNGIVTGTARVIENFDQIDRIQKNDILVTKYTDTGWTSKFAILSGIVTEYGGILCHAAIVSREYGIPAIVNCHDALSKIKDGQKITIDGSTGVVTIMKN